MLPVDDWIGKQIIHRYSFSLCHDIWMLFGQEPAHMSEKEASLGVVWIRIGLTVLVVDSVVTRPFVYRVLENVMKAKN